MPHRAVSPANSEQGFDITGSLVPNGEPGDVINNNNHVNRKRKITDVDDEADYSVFNRTRDDDEDDAFLEIQQMAAKRAKVVASGGSSKKTGGFQSMGLNAVLLKAITRKGFAVPTPIQRKTIPLIGDNQDVVGMARTGSGKTAAFVIPMIEKLKSHSVTVGARAVVLSPSRELALQTLKAVKDFGRGTDLRTILLVGGDSFEEQFSQMTTNPDIIIATPGRFLHLLVEMSLDLSTVRYIVFDEADRLFEMGFAVQLHEILHALPPSRQTLLFSATLPASLVEFAKAGLHDPKLIRLDAEAKMSPDLESAFINVKSSEKEGALLHLLQDVIQMPTVVDGNLRQTKASGEGSEKKRKRPTTKQDAQELPTEHSTVIFAATKHHVEYLGALLRACGYAVSYVYGSLDQTARRMQVESFREGTTSILIVTDVAARGIDIPMLANVINYDFPSQPKLFVHRVGRTARAGRKGWSYSLIQNSDLPYLLDLQLFLSKKLICGWSQNHPANFAQDMVVGGIPVAQLERNIEAVRKLLDEDDDLSGLQVVASKGEKLYIRTRNSASAESVKRAKDLSTTNAFQEPNMLYIDVKGSAQTKREEMLARIGGFRPAETVFEIGKRGVISETAELMKRRREKFRSSHDRKTATNNAAEAHADDVERTDPSSETGSDDALNDSDDDGLEVTVSQHRQDLVEPGDRATWLDNENFMGYKPKHSNLAEEKGYGVQSGSNQASTGSHFADAARGATMNLTNDDSKSFAEPSRASQMRWDKRSKKYVARVNDEDGSKGKRMVRGESGQKIAATFRSGRFDNWRKQNRISQMPRTGEAEMSRSASGPALSSKFKHRSEKAPKQPDKYRDDYFTKKKKFDEAKKEQAMHGGQTSNSKSRGGNLRSVDEIRKGRKIKEKRREKNARMPKRKAA